MTPIIKRLLVVTCCLALVGCSLPRGAGFTSEILAASNANTAEPGEKPRYDFSVFEVTRDLMPIIAEWPEANTKTYPWLQRQDQPASMIIAPGDVVRMTIWDAQQNSLFSNAAGGPTPLQEIQVGTDGRIFVPYIGQLRVAGMAPQTARNRVEEEMIRVIPSVQVQLWVEPGRQNTATFVSGAAANGVYPLPDRNFKVLDLISAAGGVSGELSNPQVRLIRGTNVYGIPLAELLEAPQLDTTLQGGDRLFVGPDQRYFLSLGAAGVEALHPFERADISALDAMAIIGGLSDARANPQGILILREYGADQVRNDSYGPPQARTVFVLDLTTADGLFSAGKFMIQPNDLVYVTESALGPALTALNIATSLQRIATSNF